MTVTFAEKLARMPGYQAGVPTGHAPESIAAAGIAQLASNESPFAPHPKVVEAIRGAAAAMNRYPDPDATLLRRRIAERYETEPGRIAVGNGSCEILLAAADALCEPGAEIVYAWPSFSMYPYLAALSGAREIRVPLAEGDVHDLDAMAAEVTAATQLLIVCNPNNPTGTHLPAARDRGLLRASPGPRHGRPRRGLRRVPDRSTTPTRPSTCSPTSRTWSSSAPSARCYGLAGLRVGFALGSAQLPRRGRRACASRSASTRSPRPPRPRRSSTTTTSCGGSSARWSSGSTSRRGCASSASTTAETQANFSWVDLGDADEDEVVAGLGRARRSRSGPARRSASPATSGSATAPAAENDRFLAALGELLD